MIDEPHASTWAHFAHPRAKLPAAHQRSQLAPVGTAGCTLTAVVASPDGVLTVANVGDSHAILDTGAEVVELTQEHRIGASPSELARLEAAGGRLARLNEYGAGPSRGVHDGVGPVRLWPGGM